MIADLMSRSGPARPRVLWARCTGLLAAVLLLEAMASPGSARPPAQGGPTDSASIHIRVSVASRYGLGAAGDSHGRHKAKHAAGSSFCIASNEGEPILPVMLSWLRPGENAETGLREAGHSVALPPCGASMGSADSPGRQDGAAGPEAVIIRPE